MKPTIVFFSCDLAHSVRKQSLNPLRLACSMGTFPTVIKEGWQQGFLVGKCLAPILELTQQKNCLPLVVPCLKRRTGIMPAAGGILRRERLTICEREKKAYQHKLLIRLTFWESKKLVTECLFQTGVQGILLLLYISDDRGTYDVALVINHICGRVTG